MWFKRKTYGWGWTPASWQGWLVIALYTTLILLLSFIVPKASTLPEILLTFFLPLSLLSLLLIYICYKTGEKPRWQWGKDTSTTDQG